MAGRDRPGLDPDTLVTAGMLVTLVGIIGGATLDAIPVALAAAVVGLGMIALGATARGRFR